MTHPAWLTWDFVPEEFKYLKPLAEKYGEWMTADEMDDLIAGLPREESCALSELRKQIIELNQVQALMDWQDSPKQSTKEDHARSHIERLTFLLDELGRTGVTAFQPELFNPPEPPRNWGLLPVELAYLAEPAEKYGLNVTDTEITEFVQLITDDEMDELAALGERIRLSNDTEGINAYIVSHDFRTSPEAWRIWGLMLILDALDLIDGQLESHE